MDANKRKWDIRFHRNLKIATLDLFLLFLMLAGLNDLLLDQLHGIGMTIGILSGVSMLALLMNIASMRMYDRNFIRAYAEFYNNGSGQSRNG